MSFSGPMMSRRVSGEYPLAVGRNSQIRNVLDVSGQDGRQRYTPGWTWQGTCKQT